MTPYLERTNDSAILAIVDNVLMIGFSPISWIKHDAHTILRDRKRIDASKKQHLVIICPHTSFFHTEKTEMQVEIQKQFKVALCGTLQ